MKKLFLVLVSACLILANARADLLFYDGFDYTTGGLLAPTSNTAGQHNVDYNVDWWFGGVLPNASPNPPGITSGGLSYADVDVSYSSYSGLLVASGNSVGFDMTQIGTARIQFTPAAITIGTVYWSGLLRVNDIGTLTTGANGMLLGGFNNSSGFQATSVGTVNAVLRIRQDPSDSSAYFIGTGMNSGTGTGTSANVQFDNTTKHAEGETVFVVGSYEFVAGANNDVARMWVNPAVTTFNDASPPSATITSSPGPNIADGASLLSFNLRNVNTVGAPTLQFDELRIGTTWTDVMPVPEPAAAILWGVGLLGLISGYRRMKRS